jgi:hypothetical protein
VVASAYTENTIRTEAINSKKPTNSNCLLTNSRKNIAVFKFPGKQNMHFEAAIERNAEMDLLPLKIHKNCQISINI